MPRARRKADAPGQEFLDLSHRVTLELPAGAEVRVSMPVTSPTAPPGGLAAAAELLCNAPSEALHQALLNSGVDLVRLNERVHGVLYHGYRRFKKMALSRG